MVVKGVGSTGDVEQDADLVELAELCCGHSLESFTSDAHVVPYREGEIRVGAIAILHGEGSLMLLCLHQQAKELAYQGAKQ